MSNIASNESLRNLDEVAADAGQTWRKEEVTRRQRRRRRTAATVWSLRVALLASVLGAWQFAAEQRLVNPLFLSSPTAVTSFIQASVTQPEFWAEVWSTVNAALISFGLSSVAAILTGFVLAQNDLFRTAVRPFLTILNSMPRVAFAPLFIIWFGLGFGSEVAVGVSVVYFVVLNGTLVGVDTVDSDHTTLSQQLGFSRRRYFRTVVLPSSVVSIAAALNLGLVYSFLGVVVTEMLSAPKGVGHLIQLNAGILRTDGVLGVIIVLSLLVAAMVTVLDVLESWLLRWQRP